jgi:hypothetical protein
MTLIHKNYSFPRNIQKQAMPNKISPYLQIIEIQNKPNNYHKSIHAYPPKRHTTYSTNEEKICHTINTNHTHTIIET